MLAKGPEVNITDAELIAEVKRAYRTLREAQGDPANPFPPDSLAEFQAASNSAAERFYPRLLDAIQARDLPAAQEAVNAFPSGWYRAAFADAARQAGLAVA